jgi:glycosyltransferase involved in cell wall biosynthesis
MKILLSYALVGRGGDAVQILSLAEALETIGHTVELVGPSRLQPYEFSGASGYLRNSLRRLPWWCKDIIELGLQIRLMLKAGNPIRRFKPDLVLHRAGIYDFAGTRLAGAAHCPLIVHLDAPFPAERAFRHECYFRQLHKACMKRLGQNAEFISTVSNVSRAYYTELGIPEEKISVFYNGIPGRLLARGAEISKQRPPLSQDPPFVVGFVGSLSRWHRVDLLLTALRLLDSGYPGRFLLKIAGHGEEYASLRSLEKQLNLEGKIDWLGPMPHDKAFEQIGQFDIAILPHTLPTGAPMKLFEYAALARPIITPDLPNLRDLFYKDEMCFIETGSAKGITEAVLRLTEEPESARNLGKKAQEHVQQYSWERIVMQLLESWQNLRIKIS